MTHSAQLCFFPACKTCHFTGVRRTGKEPVPASCGRNTWLGLQKRSGERERGGGEQQGEPKGLDSAKISKPFAQLWLHVWRNRQQGQAQTKHEKRFKLESKVSFQTFGLTIKTPSSARPQRYVVCFYVFPCFRTTLSCLRAKECGSGVR